MTSVSGYKLSHKRTTRRSNPLHIKNRFFKSRCQSLDISSGDESFIPCNQKQLHSFLHRSISLTSNIFQSTPNSKHTNSQLLQGECESQEGGNTTPCVCDDDLSISTLDSIFNNSFNSSKYAPAENQTKEHDDNNSDVLSIFNSSECDADFAEFNNTFSHNEDNHIKSVESQTGSKISFYDLPSNVVSLMKQYKGIDKLYDWQHECLTLSAVENHQNLLYSLPTSGGKTLVAEILMLKEILCREKNVLFIVPFVSIVQEKVWALSPFAVHYGFLIEEYAGGKGILPPRQRKQKRSIYVATIEKGLMLVRSLIENKRLEELGLVVVDELHLLGEPNRGTILEILLTNVMCCEESIQIIGMSATIGNLQELSKFINAEVFSKDFRPVELKEYIKVGCDINFINYSSPDEEKFTLSRRVDYNYSLEAEKIDVDHLGGLVMEVIPKGSCLIFCPTKKSCENVANIVLKSVLPKKLLEYRKNEKKHLQDALKMESDGRSSLIDLVVWGVAFHHSGLTFEERRVVEEAFRSGVLNVLCCTSTLAAGVNLPAQRVILRAPLVGKNFISLSMYKQMVGRAGRAGCGGHGDSILICPKSYIDKVKALLSSPMEYVNSGLHRDDGSHMRSFVLGSIASGVATTRVALRRVLSKSLLSVQAQRLDVDIKSRLDTAIKELVKLNAIELKNRELKTVTTSADVSVTINETVSNSENEVAEETSAVKCHKVQYEITRDAELSVSKLGKAAVKGCFSLCHARWLYEDLKQAQECLVLTDVLHLLYLVTPYDVAENIVPDISTYRNVLENLSEASKHTLRIIGFTEYSVNRMTLREVPKNITPRVYKRFYVTLMLNDLWKHETLEDVSEKYLVSRGVVQLLMDQAAAFCSSVIRFSEELEDLWAVKDLFSGFSIRLSHCCIKELVPLMELPSVKKNRAMQLYKAGFKTLKSIAKSDVNVLVDSIEHLPHRTAKQLIAAAKLLLMEKVENLKEQAEEFMDTDLFAKS